MLTLQNDTLFGDIFLQQGIDPIVFKIDILQKSVVAVLILQFLI